MQRPLRPPPKVVPPKPPGYLFDPNPDLQYPPSSIPKEVPRDDPYSNVRGNGPMSDYPAKVDPYGKPRENFGGMNEKKNPFAEDDVKLSDWKRLGFASEYAYAKQLGLLKDKPNPKMNIPDDNSYDSYSRAKPEPRGYRDPEPDLYRGLPEKKYPPNNPPIYPEDRDNRRAPQDLPNSGLSGDFNKDVEEQMRLIEENLRSMIKGGISEELNRPSFDLPFEEKKKDYRLVQEPSPRYNAAPAPAAGSFKPKNGNDRFDAYEHIVEAQQNSPAKRKGAMKNLYETDEALRLKAEKQAAYSHQLQQQMNENKRSHQRGVDIEPEDQRQRFFPPREKRNPSDPIGTGLNIGRASREEKEYRRNKQEEYKRQLDNQQQQLNLQGKSPLPRRQIQQADPYGDPYGGDGIALRHDVGRINHNKPLVVEDFSPRGGDFFNQAPDNDKAQKRKKQEEYKKFLDAQMAVKEKDPEHQRKHSPRPQDRQQSQYAAPSPYQRAPLPPAPAPMQRDPYGGRSDDMSAGGTDDYFATLQAMERDGPRYGGGGGAGGLGGLGGMGKKPSGGAGLSYYEEPAAHSNPNHYDAPSHHHHHHHNHHNRDGLDDDFSRDQRNPPKQPAKDSNKDIGLQIGMSSVEQKELKKAKQNEYKRMLDNQQKDPNPKASLIEPRRQQAPPVYDDEPYAPNFNNKHAVRDLEGNGGRRQPPPQQSEGNNDFFGAGLDDKAAKRKKQEEYKRFLDAQVDVKETRKKLDHEDERIRDQKLLEPQQEQPRPQKKLAPQSDPPSLDKYPMRDDPYPAPAPAIDRNQFQGRSAYPDDPPAALQHRQSNKDHLFDKPPAARSNYPDDPYGDEPPYLQHQQPPRSKYPPSDDDGYGYHQGPPQIKPAPAPARPRLDDPSDDPYGPGGGGAGGRLGPIDKMPSNHHEEPYSPSKSPRVARAQLINDIYGKNTTLLNEGDGNGKPDENWKPSGKNFKTDRTKHAISDQKAALDAQIKERERLKEEEKRKERLENEKLEKKIRDAELAEERAKQEEKEKKRQLSLQQEKDLETKQQQQEKEALARKNRKNGVDSMTPQASAQKLPLAQQQQQQHHHSPSVSSSVDRYGAGPSPGRMSKDRISIDQPPRGGGGAGYDDSRYDHINSPLRDLAGPHHSLRKFPIAEDEGSLDDSASYRMHQQQLQQQARYPPMQTPDAVDNFISNFQQRKGQNSAQDSPYHRPYANEAAQLPPRHHHQQQHQQYQQSQGPPRGGGGGYYRDDDSYGGPPSVDPRDSYRQSNQFYHNQSAPRHLQQDIPDEDLSMVSESKLIGASHWKNQDMLRSLMPLGASHNEPPTSSSRGGSSNGRARSGGAPGAMLQPKASTDDPVLNSKIQQMNNRKRLAPNEDLEKSLASESLLYYGHMGRQQPAEVDNPFPSYLLNVPPQQTNSKPPSSHGVVEDGSHRNRGVFSRGATHAARDEVSLEQSLPSQSAPLTGRRNQSAGKSRPGSNNPLNSPAAGVSSGGGKGQFTSMKDILAPADP